MTRGGGGGEDRERISTFAQNYYHLLNPVQSCSSLNLPQGQFYPFAKKQGQQGQGNNVLGVGNGV